MKLGHINGGDQEPVTNAAGSCSGSARKPLLHLTVPESWVEGTDLYPGQAEGTCLRVSGTEGTRYVGVLNGTASC